MTLFRRFFPALQLVVLLLLTVWVRCWNASDVFAGGNIFFADPDCYSRMTRVREVYEHPGRVVHRHDFENWPEGTQPHTTAPFDYLTAGLAAGIRPFAGEPQRALDWAGAAVSPLLGVVAALFLWGWAGAMGGRWRGTVLFLFAVSPILVHGTALGRPDHQSLLLLCIAAGLGAEARLLRGASRGWALAGGLAWGFGIWVSMYEPLVLLALSLVLGVVLLGRGFFTRERAVWAGALVAVLAVALGVEGWHSPVPSPEIRAYFPQWSRTVGELARTPLSAMLHWTGWLLLAAPLLLGWTGWKLRDRVAWFWLVQLGALAALTAWQARWGYFLALGFAMALPWMASAFPRGWIASLVFAVSLWPVAGEWDDRLFDASKVAAREEQRRDNLALYDVAQRLRAPRRLPVLAPWWQSPALAYWSGQPCVAGSSHESLPGTVDASRFYLSRDPAEAEAILAKRRVACVVAYDAGRVASVSSAILGQPAQEGNMAEILYERPHSAPPFLKLAYSNPAFRVFLRPAGVE
ncbi:MAG: hypothetical protein PHQ12_13855 [Chthoniobacteraceae bacterium]|nr:hypothetical protein [Chthoniobacteraceae bacterium]